MGVWRGGGWAGAAPGGRGLYKVHEQRFQWAELLVLVRILIRRAASARGLAWKLTVQQVHANVCCLLFRGASVIKCRFRVRSPFLRSLNGTVL